MRLLCLALLLCASAARADAVLTPEALVRAGAAGWIAPGLAIPAQDTGQPMVAPGADEPALVQLRSLAAWQRAAGFEGVLYDNRDRGHSDLPRDLFPRLQRLAYAPELAAAGLDYGLGGAVLVPAVVIGNSSTAVTGGAAPRSLPRLAMTAPGEPVRAFRTYAANHLYVYPEHRDHDAADLYPAAWPYMVVTQGSSGSDQPFLRALLATVAAFPRDTCALLEREGLVAPTLQMILRRSGVRDEAGYLGGGAHPSAFAEDGLDAKAMVTMAAALRPGDVPPMVRLAVEAEDFAEAAGLGGLTERLFDTPSAVARVFRGPEWEKSVTLSAAGTRDPNGRDLRFRWALLRGDPARVRIEPLDPAGARARVTVAWHDAFPGAGTAEDGTPRLSARVDIGVFADNGAMPGAPAFLSVSFPVHEARVYGPGPDGAMRLVSADYDAPARGAMPDPALHWSAPWRDEFEADGGWRRLHAGGSTERFDAQGRRIGPDGPVALRYRIDRAAGAPVLVAGEDG